VSAPAAVAPAPARRETDRVPDPVQVRAILRATLRRATRGRMMAGRSGKPRGLIFLLVMYGVLGIVLGMLAFIHPDVFSYSLLIWSFTFLMAGMTMVAESSTLLFDPRENDILGHRPIHPRTLLLAKSLGLVLLALMLGLAVNLVPMFTGLAANGARPWFPLAHLVSLLLLVVFSAAVVVFVYGLMARFVSRRTFDAIASWSQVGVTVVLIITYQLVPRLMDRMQGFRLDAAHPLLLVLPPTWFAALTQLMMGTDTSPRTLALAATAVFSTPLVGWAALRYLAGDYARQLAALGETPVPAAPTAPVAAARARAGLRVDGLLRFWLRDPIERGAFRLTAVYLARDRDIRMRLYPQIAAFLVLAVIAVVDPKTGSHFGPLMCLYFAGTLPATAMMTLKMSPQYAAADLFRYVPITGTASIFHGVRKATLLFLVVPGLLISGSILWFGLPDHHALLTTLPALMALPTLSVLNGLAGDYLPLSLPPTSGRQGAINFGMMLVGGLWLAVFSVLAMLADRFHWFWPLVGIEAAALALLHPLLLRGIRIRPLSRDGD
jgi:hypothetical protein